MKAIRLRLLLILILSTFLSYGQKLKKADKLIISNLQAHISYLADDKLEGRKAGTNGEKLAGEYIRAHFEKAGLHPKGGTNTWFQPFDIYDGKQALSSTHFIINGHDLRLHTEYFPFSFSANKRTEAAVAMALSESGVPWFLDLKDLLEENSSNPHFDVEDAIHDKAAQIASKGATALIVFNSLENNDLHFNSRGSTDAVSIPVLYLTETARKKYLADESANLDIKIKVEIGDKKRTGNNVAGYLDNGANQTIVIGAHYDHIGFGDDGQSLAGSAINNIHNGADDNASGVAALLELAKLLSQSKIRTSNFLFLAFSAEESGLIGSKYFTDHPSVDLQKVSYMINLDMVGRLNDSSKALTVGGYGTSPAWASIVNTASSAKYFSLKYDSSGAGPSDHTSFYRKDIPVLFFFTGLHSDYHKPGDDAEKINYPGELHIIRYIFDIIEKTSPRGKLAFLKTREQQMSSARFTVTLGIMPDYSFSGSGVRVDGISEGRPAQKAGLQAGDIIIRLADFSTTSLEQYMQALSTFKKGDKTTVTYKRGEELEDVTIEF